MVFGVGGCSTRRLVALPHMKQRSPTGSNRQPRPASPPQPTVDARLAAGQRIALARLGPAASRLAPALARLRQDASAAASTLGEVGGRGGGATSKKLEGGSQKDFIGGLLLRVVGVCTPEVCADVWSLIR